MTYKITFLSCNSLGDCLKTFFTDENQLLPFFPISGQKIGFLSQSYFNKIAMSESGIYTVHSAIQENKKKKTPLT